MGCFWCASLWLLARHGLVLSPVAPMLAVAVGTVFLGLIRFRGEERAAIRMAGDLALAQDSTIIGLVSVVETRDAETGQHILRTRQYVRLLAERLACHPRFRRDLTPETIEAIVKSAALHDIGKVGIPDAILRKPGRLDPAETLVMRQHTLMGKRILERAYRISGANPASSFLACGVAIACSHHEQWDGSGYPAGLKGEAIPIPARLMALASMTPSARSGTTRRRCPTGKPWPASWRTAEAGSIRTWSKPSWIPRTPSRRFPAGMPTMILKAPRRWELRWNSCPRCVAGRTWAS
jgi:adenylate cyclase